MSSTDKSPVKKFMAYFGMSPAEPYDDDYLDEYDESSSYREPSEHRSSHGSTYDAAGYGSTDFDTPAYGAYGSDNDPEYPVRGLADRSTSKREAARYRGEALESVESYRRPVATRGLSGRGHLDRSNLDRKSSGDEFDDGLVVTPSFVTLRPASFAEGRSVGEHFRSGDVVLLDLSGMDRADARRVVDFAAGLVFGLGGSMDKVTGTNRTFALQPDGLDLTHAELRDAASRG